MHSQSSQTSFSSFARVSGACLHTARNLALCNVINIKFNDVGSSFIGSQVNKVNLLKKTVKPTENYELVINTTTLKFLMVIVGLRQFQHVRMPEFILFTFSNGDFYSG